MCALEFILATILPVVGPDFAIYKTPFFRPGLERVVSPMPFVCDSYSLVVASNKDVAPFATEAPIKELESRLRLLPGVDTITLVSRKGPFTGYYIRVTRSRTDPTGSFL